MKKEQKGDLPNEEKLLDITGEEAAELNAQTKLITHLLFALDEQTQSDEGTDYKPLYYGLFNGISLIIENTTTFEHTIAALKHLQELAEEAYITQE